MRPCDRIVRRDGTIVGSLWLYDLMVSYVLFALSEGDRMNGTRL